MVSEFERYTIEVLPKDAVSDGNIANLEAVAGTLNVQRLGTSTKTLPWLCLVRQLSQKIIVPAGLRDEALEEQVESNQLIHSFAIDEVNLDYQIVGPSPLCQMKSRY